MVANGDISSAQKAAAAAIVPMAKLAKQDTGEEDEAHTMQMRAKLFVFVSGQWQERGVL